MFASLTVTIRVSLTMMTKQATAYKYDIAKPKVTEICFLTLNIPSLARQRCLPSWGPRRAPRFFFFVISQLFDAVDYSNYVFWVSKTITQ